MVTSTNEKGAASSKLSGIVGGLIVGVFLWRIQEKTDERKNRNAVEREVSVFSEKIKSLLNKPELIVADASIIDAER
jgi:hypothetical protein